jgi:hypothetical protein
VSESGRTVLGCSAIAIGTLVIRSDREPASGAGAPPKPSHRANRRWRWPAYHARLTRSRVLLALVPSIAPPLPLSSPVPSGALAGSRPLR